MSPALFRELRLRAFRFGLLIAAFPLLLVSPAYAQNWAGNISEDWFDGGNWEGGSVPGSGNDVWIAEGGDPAITYMPVVDSATPVSIRDLYVAYGTPALEDVLLTIRGDSDLSVQEFHVGSHGGVGSVLITGSGTGVEVDGWLVVGTEGGQGEITVSDGATLLSLATNGYTDIGWQGEGRITVTGEGSEWIVQNGDLWIGDGGGSGFLTVSDAGKVEIAAKVVLGSAYMGASQGEVTVESGGQLVSGGDLVLGDEGNGGTLTIRSSGRVDVGGNVIVGDDAIGEVTVESGGQLDGSGNFFIGENGGNGSVLITGDGSQVVVNGWLGVGIREAGSYGELTISDGAKLIDHAIFGNMDIGWVGEGHVTVTGQGSALIVEQGSVWIGDQGGTGTLTIGDEGSVEAGDALRIGENGNGTVTIGGGGSLTTGSVAIFGIGSGTATLNIGAAVGDTAVEAGTLTLTGSNALTGGGAGGIINFNHTDTDYVFTPNIGGTVTVNAYAGTTRLNSVYTYTGDTTVYGGVLRVDSSLSSSDAFVESGGTLGGGGLVERVVNRGTLAPGAGGSGFSTLTVNDYTAGTGAQLLLNVDFGTGESDRLVLGVASGETTIYLNRIGTGTGASDILLVEAGGGSLGSGLFTLAGGKQCAGIFCYALEQNLATDYYLEASVEHYTGTTTFNGVYTYTGDTTVYGGVLRVDSSLSSSDAFVESGGTLGGSGVVERVVNRGTLAPGAGGSGFSTLTVNDYTAGTGAQLLLNVDFGTGESDRLAVGTASGGTVIGINRVGTGEGANDILLVEAASPGSLGSGLFTLAGGEYCAGIYCYELEQDADSNYLLSYEFSPEQFSHTLQPSTVPARQALALAGQGLNQGVFVARNAFTGYLAQVRKPVRAAAALPVVMSDAAPANHGWYFPTPRRYAAYAVGTFGTGQGNDWDSRGFGGNTGVLAALTDDLAIGVGIIASRTVQETAFRGDSRTNATGGTLNVAYEPQDSGLRLYGGLLAAYLDVSSDRRYTNGAGVESSRGDTDGSAFGLALRGGYELALGERSTVMPYGEIQWSRMALDGYMETGAGSLPATLGDQVGHRTTSHLGFEISQPVRDDFTLRGRLAWGHELHGGASSVQATALGFTQTVYSDGGDRDWLESGVTGIWQMSDRSVLTADLSGRAGNTAEPAVQALVGISIGF